ncbi:MAG: hypothetical protein K2N38_13685 [Oscillospiraceae bacterium]|nr:hypothetical protein [Oscillospiraceae bacterium]
MFNKKIIIVSALLTALLTGCAENNAPYGAGFGDTDASRAPNISNADGSRGPASVGGADASYAGTGAFSPANDGGAVDNELFANTRTVGYHKLEQITAGMTYGEILDTLGSTAAFGCTDYRQYRTFDDRIIQLQFESKDDICPYSGAELFNNAMPLRDDLHGDLTIVTGGSGLVTYLTEDDSLTALLLLTSNAKIAFEDGSPASEDDLKTGTAILFETTGEVLCSFPGQAFCTKITILDVKPSPAESPYDETLEDGSVITYYPDGVTVTKFPSGGVETYLPYPDGGVLEYKPPVTEPEEQPVLDGFDAYYEQERKYGDRLPLEYEDGIPNEMVYGIMTDINGLMISYMTYYNTDEHKRDIYIDYDGNRHITMDFLNTEKAEIVFEDGTPASEDDLTPGTAVLVQYETVLETFPGQMICTKIIILQ